MKKTVNFKGQNIKVNFETANFTREIKSQEGLRIIHANGTNDFIINGKSYTVKWEMRYKKTFSTQFTFESFTCGDSEKKVIEYIIEKYGL